ncbi:phage tail tape measure protein [Methylobacterium radiotolerans]|nr:phage tail tape measure protein [Methylobacterium radiotolerans]
MTDKAIGASDAGTSLKSFLMALTPNSKDAAAAMKDLGFKAFDASGNFKPFSQIIEDLRIAFSKLTPEQRASTSELIFGSDGVRAFNILIEQGADGLAERIKLLDRMATADEAARKKLEGARGEQEKFNAAMTNFKIAVGESLLPGFTSAIQKATEYLLVLQDIRRETENMAAGKPGYGAQTFDLPTWLKQSGLQQADLTAAELKRAQELLSQMQERASNGGPLGELVAEPGAWREPRGAWSPTRRRPSAASARSLGRCSGLPAFGRPGTTPSDPPWPHSPPRERLRASGRRTSSGVWRACSSATRKWLPTAPSLPRPSFSRSACRSRAAPTPGSSPRRSPTAAARSRSPETRHNPGTSWTSVGPGMARSAGTTARSWWAETLRADCWSSTTPEAQPRRTFLRSWRPSGFSRGAQRSSTGLPRAPTRSVADGREPQQQHGGHRRQVPARLGPGADYRGPAHPHLSGGLQEGR